MYFKVDYYPKYWDIKIKENLFNRIKTIEKIGFFYD